MTPVYSSSDQLLAGHYYHDDATFQQECVDVISPSWHFVAHQERIPNPRDALAVTVGRDSLLLRRGADGTLRAFHNICRHRGAPILASGAHPASVLRCPYHGWRYHDDGRLAATPGFDDAAKLPPEADCLGLIPAGIAIIDGLVFVRPDGGSASDYGMLTASLSRQLDPFRLATLRFESLLSFEFACNWKLYVENWLESYHLPWMHRSLARDVDIKAYTVTIGDQAVCHLAPRREDASVYGGVWLWLWPLTALNSYDDGVSIERIVPVGPERTHIEYTFLFEAGTPRERRAATREMCTTVTGEDGSMCELVHRSIKCGRYSPGPLSPRHESAIGYFHRLVRSTHTSLASSHRLV